MPFIIPDNVTNPKTLRRYQRYKKQYDDCELFAKEHGYEVEKRNTFTWSFSKNGVKSVLGFDSKEEVLWFIFNNKPDAEEMFPPYNKKEKL